jgi:hypothetical protein
MQTGAIVRLLNSSMDWMLVGTLVLMFDTSLKQSSMCRPKHIYLNGKKIAANINGCISAMLGWMY